MPKPQACSGNYHAETLVLSWWNPLVFYINCKFTCKRNQTNLMAGSHVTRGLMLRTKFTLFERWRLKIAFCSCDLWFKELKVLYIPLVWSVWFSNRFLVIDVKTKEFLAWYWSLEIVTPKTLRQIHIFLELYLLKRKDQNSRGGR